MPREARFDFRGGVNLTFSADNLDLTEMRRCRNGRVEQYGGVAKRSGTQRIHTDALGGPVLGVFEWRGPAGPQIVAIANGNLHHKLLAGDTFSTVTSDFSTSVRPSFAKHIRMGEPRLFLADGQLRKWTGSVLTDVTGVGVPDALALAVYKERMFATDGTKTLYWSSVENPEDWTLINGGGQAFVETYDTEPLVGIAVAGSSLICFKENSIARYTGVTSEEIRIDRETEGISADVGCIAPKTICRSEEVLFFLSDRGPYMASEAGVQALAQKTERAFVEADQDALRNAVAIQNKARREILVVIPKKDGSQEGWVFNYRVQNWTGPWDFGWASTPALAEFERADRTESTLIGGGDGFIREGDVPEVGGLDDVARDGSGGTPIEFEAELPEILMGDPSALKVAHRPQHIAAVVQEHGIIEVTTSGDNGPTQTARLTPSRRTAEVPAQYRFRNAWRGRRPQITIAERTGSTFQLNGLILEMEMGRVIV